MKPDKDMGPGAGSATSPPLVEVSWWFALYPTCYVRTHFSGFLSSWSADKRSFKDVSTSYPCGEFGILQRARIEAKLDYEMLKET